MDTAPSADMTTEGLQGLFESLKNWDRWGDDDQRGALNHLTADHRRRAAAAVRDGVTVSLAHNLPVTPSAEVPFPAHHHMLAAGDARTNTGLPGYEASRDYVCTDVHGLVNTHVDALCHMFVGGHMFNGVPAAEVRSDGAQLAAMADDPGATARRLGGGSCSTSRPPVTSPTSKVTIWSRDPTSSGLEAAAGVTVGAGDILVVDGPSHAASAAGPLNPADGMAGIHPETLP